MLKSQWQMSLDSRLFGIIYCRARVSSRPEGNSGPQSTRSFLVWSNGPLRKRMPHAERWMRVTLDRRKQRWFGIKLPLDINNCPMLLYIHTFVFIFFRDTKFYFTFLRSSHHFFVIWKKKNRQSVISQPHFKMCQPVYSESTQSDSYLYSINNAEVLSHCAAVRFKSWGDYTQWPKGREEATLYISKAKKKRNVQKSSVLTVHTHFS